MRIEGSNSALTNLRNAPKITTRSTEGQPQPKSIGETPPKVVPLESLTSSLAALFARSGKVSVLKRKLNRLRRKKCKVVPAKGTVACIDDNDLVYIGVDFLEEILREYPDDWDEILAGVMSHEWGHASAERPKPEDLEQMNWNQIFAERRSHEVFADEMSGKLLSLMGYSPEPMIKFLTSKKDTHNLKYHDQKTRVDIIRKGFKQEERKKELAKDLFASGSYHNDYNSTLIDDDV